ncbi:SulP family inorganic anion transporter [Pannonibacter tanglangensis]|nr:SulP family inorganic anion transporter [Pannonibacter sp. XCT-34]
MSTMSGMPASTPRATAPTLAELYTPKLVTTLREGYGPARLRADAIAGLTVAIVALPLSMAIAIASGATPGAGLTTAIVGGFLVSALGGSRYQIGGPAGAFIVLVAACIARHGMEGLILATLMSGVFLMLIGGLRLGTYIKYIPHPVTVGFTAGIGVIILSSQLKDLFGLTLAGPEPGPLAEKLPALAAALPSLNGITLALSAGTIGLILLLRRYRPHWPGLLIAVVLAAGLTAGLDLPVDTIASRFGGIPAGLPAPALPDVSVAKMLAVLPEAIGFALLGAIESLLSAVVADGMTGRRHRANCELVAQGVANIGSALFGGICVTGTIARTATNVRAGATSPVSGMLHAVFLLLFLIVAAPLAGYIPLAALAGVLAVVAWNMLERHAIGTILRHSRADTLVFGATFFLTLFRDLTEAILVGVALGGAIFIDRMARLVQVEQHKPFVGEDAADRLSGSDSGLQYLRGEAPFAAGVASDPDLVVYRLSGAFFFGSAATVGAVLDRIADRHRALVLDFSGVALMDSTAALTMIGALRKASGRNVTLHLAGASPAIRGALATHGLKDGEVQVHPDLDTAVRAARLALDQARTS